MSRCVSSRRWVVAITTSLALIGIASPLAAQDDGPVVITKKQEFKWFKLDLSRTHVTLDIYGRREIDEVTPRGEDKRRDTEDRLTEELKFETEGFIGHPNFIKLELSAGIRLRQEWIESDTLDTDDNTEENLNEYDVSALILQEGDAPFTLYSRRTQNTIDRQFAGSLDSTLTEHGAMLRLKSDTLPSFFNYFHREQEQTSLQGVSDFDLVQDTFQWQSQFKPGEGQLLTWDYTYDNVDESGALRGNNQFERHDAIATHNWSFGKREHPNNLRSVLTYYKETGRFPLERIRLDESLDLRHTRNFETRYDYLFQKQTRAESEQTLHRGSAGLTHRLFDSLVSTGEIGASRLDISDSNFTSDQYYGTGTLDYTKIVPYGRLNASLTGRINQQVDSERGQDVFVSNQPRSFDSSGRMLLSQRNIVIDSIVITDGSGIVVYAENLDYRLRRLGEQIEIRKVLGGAIADGQLVLIDYRIGPEPGGTTTTTGYGIIVRYDFNEGPLTGLGLYTRYFQQDENRESDGPAVLIGDDIRELVVGAEYDIWKLSFLAEQRMRDSTLSPFDATRLEASYSDRFGPGSLLTVRANYDQIDFTDDDVSSTIFTVHGRWSQQITSRLRGSVVLLWRDETDSQSSDVTGFEQWLDLTWEYRQTTVYASIRNSMLDGDESDSLFQTFLLGIRREF